MSLSQIDQTFQNDQLAFLNKYAIVPMDYTTISMSLLATGLYDAKTYGQAGGAIDSTLSVRDRTKQIAYTSLEEVQGQQNSYKLMFRCPKEVAGKEGDYIRCWFLPWASNHLTRMVLPPKRVADPGPDIFFTAALSGCSVMVTGDPRGPTITHGGTELDRTNPAKENAFANGDARQHWNNLFQADLASRNITTPIYGIHKDDYVNRNLTGTTPEAKAYKDFLTTNSSKKMRVGKISPSGAVFGIRDAQGRWSFYLQKKATITFTRLRKVNRMFKSPKYKHVEVATGRMTKIYKEGEKVQPGVTVPIREEPEMVVDSRTVNVTISVTKFFPGGGSTGIGGVMLPPAQVKAILDSFNA